MIETILLSSMANLVVTEPTSIPRYADTLMAVMSSPCSENAYLQTLPATLSSGAANISSPSEHRVYPGEESGVFVSILLLQPGCANWHSFLVPRLAT